MLSEVTIFVSGTRYHVNQEPEPPHAFRPNLPVNLVQVFEYVFDSNPHEIGDPDRVLMAPRILKVEDTREGEDRNPWSGENCTNHRINHTTDWEEIYRLLKVVMEGYEALRGDHVKFLVVLDDYDGDPSIEGNHEHATKVCNLPGVTVRFSPPICKKLDLPIETPIQIVTLES